ncbi:hypothetical protein LCER1_G004976 [Lachnellula cervina]|uniref:LITAF domain-containing protein n=1 Tax=Lachnellula cervina TaxID=1316786 RepID=A0A7D8YJR9_9HELO|nr:hypothetical protein LCER1_G004976 [Lachnellula cervina]
MSTPYPNSAQHEAVSPQITDHRHNKHTSTSTRRSLSRTIRYHDRKAPPRNNREHEQRHGSHGPPPSYSNGGAAPGPGVNEKSAYPGHDQPLAQPQQAYSADPDARGFAQNNYSQPPPPEGHYAQEQQQPKGVHAPAAPRNNYQIATPLGSLQQGPAPVDCPVCGVREMTRTEFVSGGTTQ